MYVGEGQGGGAGHHSNFFRSDNADSAATFTSLGGIQVDNYCGGQCWYDNLVFTPAHHPDVVYLMGSFDYGLFGFNNGRAVLLSTDGGNTWSDLTQDSKPNHANATHPDQHAMVVNPNNPYQYWEGSDGGVVRTDGRFADVSYKCDNRGLTGGRECLLQEPALACAEIACQREQRFFNSAVPEPVGQPAESADQPAGRNAGQRYLAIQRFVRGLEWGDVRRRWPVGIRSGQRPPAFQHLHRTGQRRELPEWRSHQVGHWVGTDHHQPGSFLLLSARCCGSESKELGNDFPGLVQHLAHPGLGRQPGVPGSELSGIHDRGGDTDLR